MITSNRYWQGFNATPNLTFFAVASGLQTMYDELGYGYTSFAVYYHDKTFYFGYSWEDLFAIQQKFISAIKDKGYLDQLRDRDKQLIADHLKVIEEIKSTDLQSLNTDEIISLYKKLQESGERMVAISHVVEGFSLTCEDMIRDAVQREAAKHGLEFNEIFPVLTAPPMQSFIGKVEGSLREILGKIKLGQDIEHDLELLERDYFWIKNGYSGAKKLDKEWFRREALEINNPSPKISHYKKEKLMEMLDKHSRMLLAANDFIAEIHDRRKENVTVTLTYIDPLLEEIGSRFNISLDNMRFFLPSEIYSKSISNELAEERKKLFFFYFDKATYPGYEAYTGAKALEFIKQAEIKVDVKELKGKCASEGIAKGIVRVCKDDNDIENFKSGEILVACMTQPEFVPAMRKAAAIVTDEGGITCHAAIVSREMQKPCIIGTKVVTRLLKTGMVVEVDAAKGVVRILS